MTRHRAVGARFPAALVAHCRVAPAGSVTGATATVSRHEIDGLDVAQCDDVVVTSPITPTCKASLTEDRNVLGMIQYSDLAQLTVDCIGNPKCANKTWASADPTVKRPEAR